MEANKIKTDLKGRSLVTFPFILKGQTCTCFVKSTVMSTVWPMKSCDEGIQREHSMKGQDCIMMIINDQATTNINTLSITLWITGMTLTRTWLVVIQGSTPVVEAVTESHIPSGGQSTKCKGIWTWRQESMCVGGSMRVVEDTLLQGSEDNKVKSSYCETL